MLNKNYIYLIATTVLFVIITIYSSVIYINWDKELDESETAVEINLPVIEWDKYLNLSKQPE